jgi:tetratricopeptide (TPR) repeat protein
MSRKCQRILAFIFPLLVGVQAAHGQDQKPLVKETKSRAAGLPRVAPVPLLLFGAIPVSTRSQEARRLTELALDKYESVLLDDAIVQAQHATEKDPNFALGYAVLSFAARRSVGNATALARAKALLPQATPDEQLMVRWMTSIQERNLLPAIASMNDLLKRYPKNKHVLYLTSEWLYTQQDFEHSQKMMEALLQLEPNFPPVLNMLGYSYIESGRPDPVKAVASLKRYIELDPSSPNPEDSLGEVLRYAGDDQGSLKHYASALQIDPTFFTSQLGLGDTLTLMGQYDDARLEYDKAMAVSENNRDLLHARCQKALIYFWEGRAEEGRKALESLSKEAVEKREPYAQFEIGFASAMLDADLHGELQQLHTMEQWLQNHVEGMSGADRGASLANVLCEEARIASRNGLHDVAQQAISKLAQFAAQSGDLLVGTSYETARGYLLQSQGDLSTAADELSSNRHSPLAVQQLALIQKKAGDNAAAAETLTQLRYQRAPTVEWYVASHDASNSLITSTEQK